MMNLKKNKLGYTLGEIVMTTAIIGSLAAIAVPNFLRIKMNVNMEMVKQHLRILGQNMNELYNQNNPHQYPEDILTLDGNPAEELSITASLNAIDNMGYSDHRWQTVGSPPNDFALRRCPGEGLFGIAGDRCFLLTPSELTEVMPWDGFNPGDFALNDSGNWQPDLNGNGTVRCIVGCAGAEANFVFQDMNNPTRSEIENWLLMEAAAEKTRIDDWNRLAILMPWRLTPETRNPGVLIPDRIGDGMRQALREAVTDPSFYQALAAKGVQIIYFPSPNASRFGPDAYGNGVGFIYSPSFNPGDYL